MTKAKIIDALKTDRGDFGTFTSNTNLSQRETLEEILVNLATNLGIEKIYKRQSARGSYFYSVNSDGHTGFQSASNTILVLSRQLVKN